MLVLLDLDGRPLLYLTAAHHVSQHEETFRVGHFAGTLHLLEHVGGNGDLLGVAFDACPVELLRVRPLAW